MSLYAQDKNSLLPSLFDRLTDEEPRSRKEPRHHRSINLTKYRKAVLRDILSLLNATCLHSEAVGVILPESVRNTTLNYGIPAFSGVNLSDINWVEVEKSILDSLIAFEPRLDEDTLKVTIHLNEIPQLAHNSLMIEINGMLKISPYPKEFWLRTTIDVETGLFDLVDGSINE